MGRKYIPNYVKAGRDIDSTLIKMNREKGLISKLKRILFRPKGKKSETRVIRTSEERRNAFALKYQAKVSRTELPNNSRIKVTRTAGYSSKDRNG